MMGYTEMVCTIPCHVSVASNVTLSNCVMIPWNSCQIFTIRSVPLQHMSKTMWPQHQHEYCSTDYITLTYWRSELDSTKLLRSTLNHYTPYWCQVLAHYTAPRQISLCTALWNPVHWSYHDKHYLCQDHFGIQMRFGDKLKWCSCASRSPGFNLTQMHAHKRQFCPATQASP